MNDVQLMIEIYFPWNVNTICEDNSIQTICSQRALRVIQCFDNGGVLVTNMISQVQSIFTITDDLHRWLCNKYPHLSKQKL